MPYPGGKVINISSGAPYDIYVGRGKLTGPEKSKWHNPYYVGRDGTREEVLMKYKIYFFKRRELLLALDELEDKILGCHCKKPGIEVLCHGDFLRDMANANRFFRRLYKEKK